MKNCFTEGFKNSKAICLLLIFFCEIHFAKAQFYYGLQNEFGKNRIQYEDFFWTFYSYEDYDVYFYEEGKELANYVSVSAKKQIAEVEKFFDYPLDEKLQFIIYNKQSDFKQSNIGYAADEQNNIGGVTRIVGSKVILYYEGDHEKLDAQIRAGVAQIIIDEMMYGGSVQQMVKNSSVLKLPDWYVKGLISYVANDWNSDLDSRVKDGILRGKYKKINSLEGAEAVYAGTAFWKHIVNNYGETVIPNILYMTKVTHNVDHSTSYVIGLSVRNLWDECVQTFEDRYNERDTTKSFPKELSLLKRSKKSRVYGQTKISADANYIAYTTNEMGQYKVWLYNVNTGKTKRVYKSGHKIDRINDYSFPLVAWLPDSKNFSFIIERKGILVMKIYNIETKSFSERNITGFEKILDYSYNEDGKKIVMSAVQKGQTDIYVLTAASSAYYQITKDIYDDLTPRFINNSKGVVFTSNRPSDTLSFDTKKKYPERQSNMDVFLFNNTTKSPVLMRITKTPSVNEIYPTDYDSTHISYLSDENGIRNRFIAHFDSTISFIDTTVHYKTVVNAFPCTNYSRNIIEQDVNIKANKLTEVLFINGKYRMYAFPMVKPDSVMPVTLINTSFRDYKNSLDKLQESKLPVNTVPSNIQTIKFDTAKDLPSAHNDSSEIDISNYAFEDEKKQEKNILEKVSVSDTSLAKPVLNNQIKLAKQQNYYTNFSLDYVVSQLDNSFLNNTYQKFSGGGSPIYLNPGLNAFFKVSISDLFEDYRISGGMRFSIDLNNNEYYLSHENRMKNIDKQLLVHRQRLVSPVNNNVKIFTHDAHYILKLPFNEVTSIRGSVNYRNNRFVYTGVNDQYLAKRDSFENWGSTLLEYVFDNTIRRGLNVHTGLRAKLFGEYYKQIDRPQTDFFVVGCDFRYYQKIHRNFIWANRFAASSSFGKQKLIYYMGGEDNWFSPKFDNTTSISNTQNYAYQTLATNMRGFYQNARNGNSFAVINSELRLPVFNYLFHRTVSSDFIENFQLIGFADAGTAWTGTSPYSDSTNINVNVINKGPLSITLYRKHNPIIAGYGWGMRSRLWGYFIRLDRAWGLQDGIILKPIWYVSLSLDF